MKKTITAIKILVSIIFIWFLVHTSKLDFTLLLNLFYSPWLLIFTIALGILAIAISSWRWQQLNNTQHIHLSYKQTFLSTYLGIAFNNLLPGGVGGDFFRFYILNKHIRAKKSAVMLSILFDRITGLLGIFITISLMSFFYLKNISENNLAWYFLAICIIVSFLVFTVWLLSKIFHGKIGFSSWLGNKFENSKWLNPLLSLLDAIYIYRNSKKTIAKCLLASVLIQLLIAATCMLIAHILNLPALAFSDYMMAIAITQIVNLIPVAPGGFGVGEMAFANVLSLLNPGVSATYATIFVAYRIINMAIYLPGISIYLFNGHKFYFSESVISKQP